jgi:hypothetical protein
VMINPLMDAEVGSVMVHTTSNRGHSAEELAEMALDKIVFIGEDAPEPIQAQALAYRENIRRILIFYMRQAMLSERSTLRAELTTELKDTL